MIRKGVFRIDEFCTGTPFFCETVKAVCVLEMGYRHITTQSSLIFWLLNSRHGMKGLSGNEARCQGAEQV